MKQLITIFAAFGLIASTAVANTADPIKEVAVGLSSVYIPSGFDSATDAFVVANGLFPNTCYNFSRAEVSHKSDFDHEIVTFANVKQGICIRVFVPFTKEIDLGPLAAGEHTLRFVFGDGTSLEKKMIVE